MSYSYRYQQLKARFIEQCDDDELRRMILDRAASLRNNDGHSHIGALRRAAMEKRVRV